jgi:RNA polymerase sigma factor (sigma-70 family)
MKCGDDQGSKAFHAYLRGPNRRRLARLVRASYQYVWGIAVRVTGNTSDAGDIVQDLFLSLLLRPPPSGSVRSARGWLASRVLTLVRREDRARRRRERRETEAAQQIIAPAEGSSDDLEELFARLRELPDRLRDVIELRYLAGLKNREVAEVLGIAERTVEDDLRRGREMLRNRIGCSIAALLPPLDGGEGCADPGACPLISPPPGLLPNLLREVGMGQALSLPPPAGPLVTVIAMKNVKALCAVALLLLLIGGGYSAVRRIALRPTEKSIAVAVRRAPVAEKDRRTEAGKTSAPADPDGRVVDNPVAPTSPARTVISGYVFDPEGEVVADAWVGLYEADGVLAGKTYSFLCTDFTDGMPKGEEEAPALVGVRAVGETRSAASGYFEFPVEDTVVPLHVRAIGPGGDSSALAGPLSAGARDFRLVLAHLESLRGRVLDSESQTAVSDARLELRSENIRVNARTDLAGRFAFEALPPGSYELETMHSDYDQVQVVRLQIPADKPELQVFLANATRGTRVSGVVTDRATGRPLEGAVVRARSKYKGISGPSGEYAVNLPEVERGHVDMVTASVPGYASARADLPADEDIPYRRDFALAPALTVPCRIERAGGQPAPNAKVIAWAGGSMVSARADEDGRCALEDVPPLRKAYLVAFHPEFGRAILSDVTLGENREEPLVIVLEKLGGTVAVEVRDTSGAPVADVPVLVLDRLQGKDGETTLQFLQQTIVLGANSIPLGTLRAGTTDAAGKALFPDTFAGDCVAQALGKDYPLKDLGAFRRMDFARSAPRLVHIEEGDSRVEAPLVLWRPFKILGNVTASDDGGPVQHVEVTAIEMAASGEWEQIESCFTNEKGNFQFLSLDPMERHAVAVRPAGRTPLARAWKRASRQNAGAPAGKEEKFLTIKEFSAGRPTPKDFVSLVEVPHSRDAQEGRVDLVVDLPGDASPPDSAGR